MGRSFRVGHACLLIIRGVAQLVVRRRQGYGGQARLVWACLIIRGVAQLVARSPDVWRQVAGSPATLRAGARLMCGGQILAIALHLFLLFGAWRSW